MLRVLLAATAATLALAAPASAQTQSIAMSGKEITGLGPWTFGDSFGDERPTLPVARTFFGEPTSADARGRTSCRARWAALGMRIDFVDLGGGTDPCSQGAVQGVLLRGDGLWPTPKGLTLGDPSARLRELYPRATRNRFKRRQIDLVRARLFGAAPTGILSATVAGGRVSSFVLYVGAGGE